MVRMNAAHLAKHVGKHAPAHGLTAEGENFLPFALNEVHGAKP
jgi:hypothetical protein